MSNWRLSDLGLRRRRGRGSEAALFRFHMTSLVSPPRAVSAALSSRLNQRYLLVCF